MLPGEGVRMPPRLKPNSWLWFFSNCWQLCNDIASLLPRCVKTKDENIWYSAVPSLRWCLSRRSTTPMNTSLPLFCFLTFWRAHGSTLSPDPQGAKNTVADNVKWSILNPYSVRGRAVFTTKNISFHSPNHQNLTWYSRFVNSPCFDWYMTCLCFLMTSSPFSSPKMPPWNSRWNN